jgi:hypothetical protein
LPKSQQRQGQQQEQSQQQLRRPQQPVSAPEVSEDKNDTVSGEDRISESSINSVFSHEESTNTVASVPTIVEGIDTKVILDTGAVHSLIDK